MPDAAAPTPAVPPTFLATRPIIVTALMGDGDFAWADALRRAHFPPERNQIPAHISLFHHLPPARAEELVRLMKALAREYAPPRASVSGVMALGGGTAFAVDSPALLAIRQQIAAHFAQDLIAQDQGQPRLHITIQNKVPGAEARALQAVLTGAFTRRPLTIKGLAAWEYLSGPWRALAQVSFRGRAAA